MIKKNTLPVILSILIAICLGNITNMHTSFRNNQRFPIYKLPNAGQITPKNIVQQTIADTIKNQHSPQSWPLYQNKNTTHRIPFKPIPSTSKVKYFSTVPTVQNTNKMSLTMPEQLDKTQLIIPELPKEPSIKETSNIENLLKKKYSDTLIKEHLTKLSPQVQEKLLYNAAINENIAQKITNKLIDNMRKQKENTFFNRTKQLTSKISNTFEEISESIEHTLEKIPGSNQLTNFLDSIKKHYSENNQNENYNEKKNKSILQKNIKMIKKQINNIKQYFLGKTHNNSAKKLIEQHSVLPPTFSGSAKNKNF